jgi:hypothetical protein
MAELDEKIRVEMKDPEKNKITKKAAVATKAAALKAAKAAPAKAADIDIEGEEIDE